MHMATDQPWDYKSIRSGFDATLATARDKSNYRSLNNNLYNIISYPTFVSICYSALTTTPQATTITHPGHPTTHTSIPTTTVTKPPHASTTQKTTTKCECIRTKLSNYDNTDQETSVVRSMFPLYRLCIMHKRRSCYGKNLR